MAKNNIIALWCFGQEIGKIGHDEHTQKTYFQYHPDFLASGKYENLFPMVIHRTEMTQVFSRFLGDTFRSLPPMIADSLPDLFGNTIFKAWLNLKGIDQISVLEQLAYVSNRGMGALEFLPSKHIPRNTSIDIDEVTQVLKQVLDTKNNTLEDTLDSKSLHNIFKMGSSAGGAQPKLLISEHKKSKYIIPGDLVYGDQYHHYLVKLHLEEGVYNRALMEYIYYLTASSIGIRMMPSKMINTIHFATLRYDRHQGKKVHTLTATGLTGWDFKDPSVSSYENLFDLGHMLRIPHAEITELYERMVFNLIFANTDDHLKNHAFVYDEIQERWHLSPAYDLTYALNPLLNYKRTSRALSIGGKRHDIRMEDLLEIAEQNTIKNPSGIIQRTLDAVAFWELKSQELGISSRIIGQIKKDFWKEG